MNNKKGLSHKRSEAALKNTAGVTQLGYQAPGLDGTIPVQTQLVQNFFTFGAVGAQALVFPVIALVLLRSPDDRKKAKK